MKNEERCEGIYNDCDEPKRVIKGKYDNYIYCDKCASSKNGNGDLGECCNNPDIIDVNYPRIDGSPLKRDFCKSCGWHRQKKMNHRDEWKSLPLVTKTQTEILEQDRKTRSKSFYDYCKEQKEKLYEDKNEQFWKEYSAYLKTQKWKTKRMLALRRDNNVCQACFIKTAEQVHHLTYENVFDENIFELVSVCATCHDKIHNKL